MQIIKVVPLKNFPSRGKISSLSYFSLRDDLTSGSLVLITLNKNTIPAIVAETQSLINEKMSLKSLSFSLKKINTVISAEPVLQKFQMSLAKQISFYYHSSFGKSLALFLSPAWQKSALKNKKPEIFCFPKVTRFSSKNNITLHKLSTIDGPLKLIKSLLSARKPKNGQILIIFPNKIWVSIFKAIAKEINLDAIRYASDLTLKNMRAAFADISAGIKIIYGTKSALFAPFSKLEAIYMINPDGYGLRNEQEPRFSTLWVAKTIAGATGARLHLIDSAPTLEEYYFAKQNGKIFKETSLPLPKISIVDMRKSREDEGFQVLAKDIREKIKSYLDAHKKILIFINRKGESTTYICRDCGWIKICPDCNIPLTYHKTDSAPYLLCHHCNRKFETPKICDNCQSWNITTLGVGIQKIESYFKENFPQVKINTQEGPATNESVSSIQNDSDVLIATQALFELPVSKKFDLVVFSSVDNFLSIPDYQLSDKLYRTVTRLIQLCDKEMLIQTYSPENETLTLAVNQDYETFFSKEMSERKQFFYPPFSELIKISSPNKPNSLILMQNERKRMEEMLERAKLSDKALLLGPVASFPGGTNINLLIKNIGLTILQRNALLLPVDPKRKFYITDSLCDDRRPINNKIY